MIKTSQNCLWAKKPFWTTVEYNMDIKRFESQNCLWAKKAVLDENGEVAA